MRKVDDVKKRKEKIMTFIVATNVIASRPPERRPPGTPHARANYWRVSDNMQRDQTIHDNIGQHLKQLNSAKILHYSSTSWG